ncbi:MAG: polysaccharide deacetylase family protein [Clostridia bacterium]|nr:polysaccharide deacetylase family protein [Clostridia bacterium]
MVFKLKRGYMFLAVCAAVALAGALKLGVAVYQASAVLEPVQLPVVMYHQITKNPARAGQYCVMLSELENDLKYIKDKGYNTVDLEQLTAYVYDGEPLPDNPIMLTFDDGYETVYSYLLPLLEKYDMCAVASVVGAYTDMFTQLNDHTLSYSYMDWDEVSELAAGDRIEIQSHSYDLHKLNNGGRNGAKKVSGESVHEYSAFLNLDLGKMQTLMEENTGYKPCAFTYPYGCYSKESKDILKSMGFKAALVCEERINYIDTENTDWIYRIGRFNRPHGVGAAEFFSRMNVK